MTRVLVTGAGGPAGAALVRELRARGHQVTAVDAGAHPGVVRVPYASDPGLVEVLQRLVDLGRIHLVVPTVSEELPVLSASVALLNPAHTVVGPERAVGLAHDKLRTARALQEAGVPVPAFGVPEEFDDAHTAMRALGGAVVTKPRVSRGGRGVRWSTTRGPARGARSRRDPSSRRSHRVSSTRRWSTEHRAMLARTSPWCLRRRRSRKVVSATPPVCGGCVPTTSPTWRAAPSSRSG